jgi:sugar O-acyltransferase (sialic acid O-acetyltransferase NeuD family)
MQIIQENQQELKLRVKSSDDLESGSMKIYIAGAGGHAKVVTAAAQSQGLEVEAYLDDAKAGTTLLGRPVLREDGPLNQEIAFVVAIGNNKVRETCFKRLLHRGLQAILVKHERAIIDGAACDLGSQIIAGAILNQDAKVGRNCIINSGAIVEHDCQVGDHCHVAPGAIMGGGSSLGEGSLLGLGAILLPGVKIGQNVTIGAGSVVIKDVESGARLAGAPARNLT